MRRHVGIPIAAGRGPLRKSPNSARDCDAPEAAQAPSDDLFRSSLEAIIDPNHELVQLSSLIDWDRFDDAFGTHYHDRKGRHGLPTRLMAGLHLLKHMKGFSDDETCAAWLENPYFQAFCGETHFQHRLPFDRSSSPGGANGSGRVIWRHSGRNDCGGREDKAVSERQLERITVDTTVQTKAVAHPTDSHLILRAIEWLNRAATRHRIKLRQSFCGWRPGPGARSHVCCIPAATSRACAVSARCAPGSAFDP